MEVVASRLLSPFPLVPSAAKESIEVYWQRVGTGAESIEEVVHLYLFRRTNIRGDPYRLFTAAWIVRIASALAKRLSDPSKDD